MRRRCPTTASSLEPRARATPRSTTTSRPTRASVRSRSRPAATRSAAPMPSTSPKGIVSSTVFSGGGIRRHRRQTPTRSTCPSCSGTSQTFVSGNAGTAIIVRRHRRSGRTTNADSRRLRRFQFQQHVAGHRHVPGRRPTSTTNPGSGNLFKNGTGTAYMAGTNSYNGTTTVNQGIMDVQSSAGLGTNAGNVFVSGARNWHRRQHPALVIANSIALTGTGIGVGTAATNGAGQRQSQRCVPGPGRFVQQDRQQHPGRQRGVAEQPRTSALPLAAC